MIFQRTIILDPPHGIETPGKRSPDGKHREYLWGRKRLKEVAALLRKKGVKVRFTAEGENEPGLNVRQFLMNAIPSPAFVFSLHNNAAGNGLVWKNVDGFSEIYTSRGLTPSDFYAGVIYKCITKHIPELSWRKDMTDGDIDKEANFTVLLSKHPSALLEWGFQDDKGDIPVLNNPDTNNRLVHAIAEALMHIARR